MTATSTTPSSGRVSRSLRAVRTGSTKPLVQAGEMLALLIEVLRSGVTQPRGYWGDVREQLYEILKLCWVPMIVSCTAFGFGAPGLQAEHLLHDPRLREAFDAAAESAAQASWSDFVAVDEAAERIVGRTNPAATRSAGLCFGGQRLAFARGYTPAARQLATDALITGYDEREANTGEGR